MTNEQIIMDARIALMKENKIRPSGRIFHEILADGSQVDFIEPEEIHTYQAWKELGYQVQKGMKAVAQIQIWKHTVKKAKSDEEKDKERMIMKVASFFTFEQVKPIEKK